MQQGGIAGSTEVLVPGSEMDFGPVVAGDFHGSIGGAGVHQDELIGQASDRLEASIEEALLVLGDEADRQARCQSFAQRGLAQFGRGFIGPTGNAGELPLGGFPVGCQCDGLLGASSGQGSMTHADGHLAQEDPAFRVEGALLNGCAGQSPGVRDVLGFEGVPGGKQISLEGNLGQGQRTCRSGEAGLLFNEVCAPGQQLPRKTGSGLRGIFPGPMGGHMLGAQVSPLPPPRRLFYGFAEG